MTIVRARGSAWLPAVVGALAISTSAVLVRRSGAGPDTAAVFRCLYALPFLLAAAAVEQRSTRALGHVQPSAAAAGVLLGLALLFTHHAIDAVGAGLATVLGNLQVVAVIALAWLLLGERPPRAMLLVVPVVLVGALLTSGLLESGSYGEDPARGLAFGILTSLSYAGFVLLLRAASGSGTGSRLTVLHVTAAACVTCAVLASATGRFEPLPTWPAHGWLGAVAISSHVVGWTLVASAIPRLAAATAGLILLLQPVGAITLGALALDETPSVAQLLGVALILLGVMSAVTDGSTALPDDPSRPRT